MPARAGIFLFILIFKRINTEMKNSRYKVIKEAAAVNDVQLSDLYDAVSNIETQIIKLNSMAMKFSDPSVKKAAMVLKAKAQDFSNMLDRVMVASSGTNNDPATTTVPEDPNIDNAIADDSVDNSAAAGQGQVQDLEQRQPDDRSVIEGKTYKPTVKEAYLLKKKFPLAEKTIKALKLNKNQINKLLEASDFEFGSYMAEGGGFDVDPMEKPDPEQASGSLSIDLTQAYSNLIEGLDDDTFNGFKQSVSSALEQSIDNIQDSVGEQAAGQFTQLIQGVSAATSPEEFDTAMNSLYDFADSNSIIIKTAGDNE